MPELPEVETVRRGLEAAFVENVIAKVDQRRPDLRFPFPDGFALRLQGRKTVALHRRAKYLVAQLDDGTALIMHLGMSGRFTVYAPQGHVLRPGVFAHNVTLSGLEAGPHDHVIFDFEDGLRVVFSDHRRFGLMTLHPFDDLQEHKLFASIGVEPLSAALTPFYLDQKLAGKHTPIKSALLDQKIVAGIGNIYACEALFYAGISPRRSSHTVPGKRSRRLVQAIQSVLTRAIEAGGSSLRDYAQADGELGYFQTQFAVYDREGESCQTSGCEGTIQRLVQSNRSTFFCSTCQR